MKKNKDTKTGEMLGRTILPTFTSKDTYDAKHHRVCRSHGHDALYKRHKSYVHRQRKENIVRNTWGIFENGSDFTPTILTQPHRLDKGKVHCSCPMCTAKKKNLGWKHRDKVNLEKGWSMSDSSMVDWEDDSTYLHSRCSTDKLVYSTVIDKDIDWESLLEICEKDREEQLFSNNIAESSEEDI